MIAIYNEEYEQELRSSGISQLILQERKIELKNTFKPEEERKKEAATEKEKESASEKETEIDIDWDSEKNLEKDLQEYLEKNSEKNIEKDLEKNLEKDLQEYLGKNLEKELKKRDEEEEKVKKKKEQEKAKDKKKEEEKGRKKEGQKRVRYSLRKARPAKRRKSLPRHQTLQAVDIDTYHPVHLRDEFDQKIIDIASDCKQSQVDCFVYESKSFVITSWLTAVRIFQYEIPNSRYIETKRLPKRFVEISDNLITSLHHSEDRIYVAHLWGSREKDSDPTKPYLDVLDLEGTRLKQRQYYNGVVRHIYSDKDYVYVKTTSPTFYIHPKEYFNCICYKIDFRDYGHIVGSWIERPSFNTKTTLPLVTARPKDLLLTKWDVLDGHEITCCYRFNELYTTISCHKVDSLFILHRNLDLEDDLNEFKSLLECGFTTGEKENPDAVFAHEVTVKFKYTLIQILPVQELLFIFGYTTRASGRRHYEIGCIYMPCLKPIWTAQVSKVDENCHILAHQDHVVIIKSRQQLASFTFSSQTKCDQCNFNLVNNSKNKWHTEFHHDSIFSGYQIYRNVYMKRLGASIFKKLE